MSGASEAPAQEFLKKPPPVIVLSSRVDLNQLWQGTETARKYVQVVAYTLPPDATGNIPPPRFRAFGLDMSTGVYVFVIDGKLQSELGLFTEKMLSQKAILITTPPGVRYDGLSPRETQPPLPGRSRMDALASDGSTADAGPHLSWGTQPIAHPPETDPPGGHPEGLAWLFDWRRLPEMARAVNNVIPDSSLPIPIL
jgi:hypothetical protein